MGQRGGRGGVSADREEGGGGEYKSRGALFNISGSDENRNH